MGHMLWAHNDTGPWQIGGVIRYGGREPSVWVQSRWWKISAWLIPDTIQTRPCSCSSKTTTSGSLVHITRLASLIMSKHVSRPYTPSIANVYYLAGLIGSWGCGIKKICQACKEHGSPYQKIQFIASEDRITRTSLDMVTEKVTEKVTERWLRRNRNFYHCYSKILSALTLSWQKSWVWAVKQFFEN